MKHKFDVNQRRVLNPAQWLKRWLISGQTRVRLPCRVIEKTLIIIFTAFLLGSQYEKGSVKKPGKLPHCVLLRTNFFYCVAVQLLLHDAAKPSNQDLSVQTTNRNFSPANVQEEKR